MVLKENIFKRLYIKYQPLFILGLSVFAGFLNYLFQVLAGRYVSPALFGKITVAISVIGILTIPGVAAMKGNAVTVAGTDIQDASFYYRHAVKKLSPLTIIPILILSIFSYFFLNSIGVTILLFIVGILMFLSYYQEGYLQGLGKPIVVIVIDTIVAAFRLFLGFLLLYLTQSIYSIPAYSIIGNAIVTIGLLIYIKRTKYYIPNKIERKEIIQEGIKNYYAALVSVATLTLFQYIDVFSIKAFFTEEIVGQYSATTLFSKMILYIPTAFITIMIPRVAASKSKKESLMTLNKTILQTVSLTFSTFIVLLLFKKQIILFILGEEYLPCLDYFLPAGIMTASFSVMNVMINYLISIRDRKFVSAASIISLICSVLSVLIIHTSVSAELYALSAIYLITGLIFYVRALKIEK